MANEKNSGKWLTVRRAGVALVLSVFAFLSYRVSLLTAEPGEDKDCDPVYPTNASTGKAIELGVDMSWAQRGGTINDASCLDETTVHGVVAVQSEQDILKALNYAQAHDLKVSIAGVKHSMGGHAFARGNLVLDMTPFKEVAINESKKTMKVQSGATWHDIQTRLHPKYAVKAMQSTDIFSVGGSISVNAHGMDHQAGALEKSIVSLRVMMPDGSIRTLSRNRNTELYDLVVGGYGLFGIILDAEIEIVDNDVYESSRRIISYKDFPATFNDIASNSNIGLTYTHLSTAPGKSFLDEAIVYVYTKTPEAVSVQDIPPLQEVSSVKLRRFVMNMSKYGGVFQTLRWWSEKYLEPKMESCTISRNAAQGSGEACMVSRNEPMHDSVPYLKNSLKKETDILHEYFIPRENILVFIDGVRESMRRNDTSLLNASIRVVGKERNFLTYAPKDAFSVVLYINQSTGPEGNAKMKKVTQELIDLSTAQGGRFFLPYQLHYTPEQLREAYPEAERFFTLKRAYDPEERLTNTWYEKYGKP